MKYPEFDRSRILLKPLEEREHDLDLSVMLPLECLQKPNPILEKVGSAIVDARRNERPVIMMIGAHVIRSGVQRFLIDLIRRGYLTCIAGNGAMLIHDFEFALAGATTESVAKYIAEGQFGLWSETGMINDIVKKAASQKKGLGECVGEYIHLNKLPHSDWSISAAAWENDVLLTSHIGIGYDIIHEHPNFDPGAFGETTYRDFLRYAHMLENLSHGVLMSLGSAVMAPEVFLKALAMARNVAHQKGETVGSFLTLVTDLHDLPDTPGKAPDKNNQKYYFRPWKTMLDRTVSEDGCGYYCKARHDEAIPQLWAAVNAAERNP